MLLGFYNANAGSKTRGQAPSKGHKKNLSGHDMINGKEKNKVLLGKFIFMFLT